MHNSADRVIGAEASAACKHDHGHLHQKHRDAEVSGCSHERKACDRLEDHEHSAHESSLCRCCQSGPEQQGTPCGDGSVRCSFVPSSEELFDLDYGPAVAFLPADVIGVSSGIPPASIANCVLFGCCQVERAQHRCAILCTWLI